ncbi:hypothetical protein GGI43DRAFT_132050 [Trichoderma evansii]
MASPAPQVQIIDKSDHTKQRIVTLHDAYPLPPLAKGNIRIRSRLISVTTNNFTYARLGHILGWWDVWAAIPSLPAPYNDSSKYGRISAWGYCEVTESQNDKVAVGTQLFGYIPIGDYPEILQVVVDDETGHILETTERRAGLMHIYNRYQPSPPGVDLLSADRSSAAWDSAARALGETGYLLNRYAFGWDKAKVVHPSGASLPWTSDDADLTDAVVVFFGASGKTSLTLAHQLRRARPTEHQPRKIVAVGSAKSQDFTEGTGLFSDVLLYEDLASGTDASITAKLGIDANTKVLLANFSGRGTADQELHATLTRVAKSVVILMVGGDPTGKGSGMGNMPSGVLRCRASPLRDAALKIDGATAFFEDAAREWVRFKEDVAAKTMKLQWGKGLEEYSQGWDALSSGGVDPTLGLVYEI